MTREVKWCQVPFNVYQGRYKAFLVQKDDHLLQLIRYVEQNPLRAKLVHKAENWQWGSAFHRKDDKPKELLSPLPVDLPGDYYRWINTIDKKNSESVASSINKSKPLGTERWVDKVIKKYDLVATTRPPGRPKKGT